MATPPRVADMRRIIARIGTLFMLGLTACAAPNQPADLHPEAAAPAIIPVRELLQADAAAAWGYQISPDGRRLSWIAVVGNLPLVHVRLLGARQAEVVATPFAVAKYFW